jgi:hypothetical protein
MIDYDIPDEDPVVAEVRRAREELAAKFDYDLRSMMSDYQRRQATNGRTYASPSDIQADSARVAKKVG